MRKNYDCLILGSESSGTFLEKCLHKRQLTCSCPVFALEGGQLLTPPQAGQQDLPEQQQHLLHRELNKKIPKYKHFIFIIRSRILIQLRIQI